MSVTSIILFSLLALSLSLTAYSLLQIRNLQHKLKTFFQGGEIHDADELLERYAKNFTSIEQRIGEIRSALTSHDQRISPAVSRVFLKRFNPFQDMGGDMSFVLVLLNEENTGVMMTNIVMREGARMYAKQVVKGKVETTLSEEELEALREAIRH